MRARLLCLVCLLVPVAAGASPITWEWQLVFNAAGGANPLPANTPGTLTLKFDPIADTCATVGRGQYFPSGQLSFLGQTYNAVGGGIEVNNAFGNECQLPLPGFVDGQDSAYTLRLFFFFDLPYDYTDPTFGVVHINQAIAEMFGPFHDPLVDPTSLILGGPRLSTFGFNTVVATSTVVSSRVVPEPASLLLLVTGALGLLEARRRRRR